MPFRLPRPLPVARVGCVLREHVCLFLFLFLSFLLAGRKERNQREREGDRKKHLTDPMQLHLHGAHVFFLLGYPGPHIVHHCKIQVLGWHGFRLWQQGGVGRQSLLLPCGGKEEAEQTK